MDPIVLDIIAQPIVEIDMAISEPITLDLYEAESVVITPAENTYINRRIFIQPTEPTNPIIGDLWINTT